MSGSAGFAKISTAAVRALIRENCADFEVFLPRPGHEEPVLYRRSDAGLSEPDFKRMAEHGVSRLYLRATDQVKCEQALEAKLSAILNNPDVSPDDKAEIFHGTGKSVARDLVQNSVTTAGLERTSLIVDNMINCVLEDPLTAAFLVQMAGHERSTAGHMIVVANLAIILGAAVYGQDLAMLQMLGFAGMLHDLGKLSISPDILNKPTPLTREELILIHQHPIESVRLIGEDPHVTQAVRQMILQHHERIDGRGYPLGVSGADLLHGSRVLSVVDSFHAMIGQRSYREPLLPPDAVRVLATQSGKQFDAEVLTIWQQSFEQYWAQQAGGRRLEVPEEDGELSPRHEHRPTPPPPKITQQRAPRYACKGRTMVSCIYAGRLTNVTAAPAEFGALVHDVSRTGLCIYAAHPMYRGEIVHVQIKVGGEVTWLRAVVAWGRQFDANSYRIGLRFTQRIGEAESRESAQAMTMREVAEAAKATPVATCPGTPATGRTEGQEPVREKRDCAMKTLAGIAAMRRPDAAAQRTAITLAMTGDVKIRLKAVDALMSVGTKLTREALVAMLHDVNPEVRERAVMAVGTARVTGALEALRHLLRDPVERVALRAAGALGRLGDTTGLNLVEMMLETDGPGARLAAVALGEITGHRFGANREGVKAARRYMGAKKLVGA